MQVELELSQPIPYRIFILTEPNRIVFDFKEIDWGGFSSEKTLKTEKVKDLRFGAYQAGWSRMVVELTEPMILDEVEMRTDPERGNARMVAKFKLSNQDEFKALSGVREEAGWDLPKSIEVIEPKKRQIGDAPLIVVLDPGHGGIDSGAHNGGKLEKDGHLD